MNLKDIIIKYLKDNGYGGLLYIDSECGCELDDLMPCDVPNIDCQLGYKIPSNDPDNDQNWVISETKEDGANK